MNIGENMRRVRETLKLSRNDVQETTGINYQYLGTIERNESSPTIDILLKLAKCYNVTVSELIGEVTIYNSKLSNILKKFKFTDRNDVYILLKSMDCLSARDIEILLRLIIEYKSK